MTLSEVGSVVGVAGFLLALVNAWKTWWHRGSIRMVRPSLVAFLDARGTDGPKVWFRALLYSTAQKGNVLESMYVRLQRGETKQNFSFWVCGEREKLVAGCGLYVGQSGVALNHHFVLPKDGSRFEFLAGDYVVEVLATLVGSSAPMLLALLKLHLSDAHASALKEPTEAVYFDWWPDSQRYNPHVRHTEPAALPDEMIRSLFGSFPLPEEPAATED
jgi:hypothetical protein